MKLLFLSLFLSVESDEGSGWFSGIVERQDGADNLFHHVSEKNYKILLNQCRAIDYGPIISETYNCLLDKYMKGCSAKVPWHRIVTVRNGTKSYSLYFEKKDEGKFMAEYWVERLPLPQTTTLPTISSTVVLAETDDEDLLSDDYGEVSSSGSGSGEGMAHYDPRPYSYKETIHRSTKLPNIWPDESIDYWDSNQVDTHDVRRKQNMTTHVTNSKAKTEISADFAKNIKMIEEKKQLRIIILLDKTGSMEYSGYTKRVIKSYNELIRNLLEFKPFIKRKNINLIYTLVKFDENLGIFTYNDITSENLLTDREYKPNGSTALYDTLGCSLSELLQEKNEKNNILYMISDGENTSGRIFEPYSNKKLYTQKDKNTLPIFKYWIKKATSLEYNWVIRYFGANQNSYFADKVGINHDYIYNFNWDSKKDVYKSIKKISFLLQKDIKNILRNL